MRAGSLMGENVLSLSSEPRRGVDYYATEVAAIISGSLMNDILQG